MRNKNGLISLIGVLILIILIAIMVVAHNVQTNDVPEIDSTDIIVETRPINQMETLECHDATVSTDLQENIEETEADDSSASVVEDTTTETKTDESVSESTEQQETITDSTQSTTPEELPTEPVEVPEYTEPTTPLPTEEKPVVDQISNGNSITLDTRYLTVDPAQFLTVPREQDFGIYYNHAITLYNAILLNAERLTIVFDIEGTADSLSHITPELEAAMAQAREDWEKFSNTFNEKVLNGYVEIQTESESFYSATFVTCPTLVYSELSERKTDSQVYYEANIEAGLYNGMSEKEAISKINSYICKKLNYAIDVANPITALKIGKGNCAAYSILFEGMCDNANIACDVVSGYATSNSNSGPHGWNYVKVGETWYYIDVCWNDTTGNAYFLSEELWGNHVLS